MKLLDKLANGYHLFTIDDDKDVVLFYMQFVASDCFRGEFNQWPENKESPLASRFSWQ